MNGQDHQQYRLRAAGTLIAGLGVVAGITLTAKGRGPELYPLAAVGALVTAFLGAAYALGGDRPVRFRP